MGFPPCQSPSSAPSCQPQRRPFESGGSAEFRFGDSVRSVSACGWRRPVATTKTVVAATGRAATVCGHAYACSAEDVLDPPRSARDWLGGSLPARSTPSRAPRPIRYSEKDCRLWKHDDDGNSAAELSCTMQPWWNKLVREEHKQRSKGAKQRKPQRMHKPSSSLQESTRPLHHGNWVGTGPVRSLGSAQERWFEQREGFTHSPLSSPSPSRELGPLSVRSPQAPAHDTGASPAWTPLNSITNVDDADDDITAFEVEHLKLRACKLAGQYCGRMERLQEFNQKWFRRQAARARRKAEELDRKKRLDEEEKANTAKAEPNAADSRDSFSTRSKKRNSLHSDYFLGAERRDSGESDFSYGDSETDGMDDDSDYSLDSFGNDLEEGAPTAVRKDSMKIQTRASGPRNSGTFPAPSLTSERPEGEQESKPTDAPALPDPASPTPDVLESPSPKPKSIKASELRDSVPRMTSILKKTGTTGMRSSSARVSSFASCSWYTRTPRVKIVDDTHPERPLPLGDKRATLDNTRMSLRATPGYVGNVAAPVLKNPPTEAEAVRLANRYRLALCEVRESLAEFKQMDIGEQGCLTRDQFLGAVRSRLLLAEGEEIPAPVLHQVWRTTDVNGSGMIDFEEFVAWTQMIAFSDIMAAADPNKQKLRHLSKQHGVSVPDIEFMWKVFQKYDNDKSGQIEKREFQDLLRELLHSRDPHDISKDRLDRFWADADHDKSSSINFSEFLVWYMRYFVPFGSGASDGDADPASMVYRKLGTDRLSNYWNVPVAMEEKEQAPSLLAVAEKDSNVASQEKRKSIPILGQRKSGAAAATVR